MWRSFFWLPLVATCAHTSGPASDSDCQLVTERDQLASCVGKRVTLRGVVSRSKIPSILGVDVDAEYALSDRIGRATGTLETYTIPEREPGGLVMASKGPGTYYALRSLDGDGLAEARAD